MFTAAPRWDLDGRVDGEPCRLLVNRRWWPIDEAAEGMKPRFLKGFEGKGLMIRGEAPPPTPGTKVRLWFAHPLNDSLGVTFDVFVTASTVTHRERSFEWKTYGPPVDVGNVVG